MSVFSQIIVNNNYSYRKNLQKCCIHEKLNSILSSKSEGGTHLNNHQKGKKNLWSKIEDNTLIEVMKNVNEEEKIKWQAVSNMMKIHYVNNNIINYIERSGKQCRERWIYHINKNKDDSKNNSVQELNNDIRLDRDKNQWTDEEEEIMLNYVLINGKKWIDLCKEINKSDKEIKNHYYKLLRKKVRSMRNILIEKYPYFQKIINSEKELYDKIKDVLSYKDMTEDNILKLINVKDISFKAIKSKSDLVIEKDLYIEVNNFKKVKKRTRKRSFQISKNNSLSIINSKSSNINTKITNADSKTLSYNILNNISSYNSNKIQNSLCLSKKRSSLLVTTSFEIPEIENNDQIDNELMCNFKYSINEECLNTNNQYFKNNFISINRNKLDSEEEDLNSNYKLSIFNSKKTTIDLNNLNNFNYNINDYLLSQPRKGTFFNSFSLENPQKYFNLNEFINKNELLAIDKFNYFCDKFNNFPNMFYFSQNNSFLNKKKSSNV